MVMCIPLLSCYMLSITRGSRDLSSCRCELITKNALDVVNLIPTENAFCYSLFCFLLVSLCFGSESDGPYY